VNNYSTHAIEFFRTAPLGRAQLRAFTESREGIIAALGMMGEGEHFLMPDYGRVFANGTRRGDFRDLLRLPFPTCILEYFCPERILGPNAPASAVREDIYFPKRRIAILTDTRYMAGVQGTHIDGSILVIACFEIEDDVWTFAPAAGLLNPTSVEVDPDTGLFTIDTVPFLWESYNNPSYTQEERVYDIADEVTAAVEFMMTINCENVKRDRVEAPAKLNKKRAASGKVPMFSYWILDVFKEQFAAQPAQGGAHASPRFHFRRGHIRRLASGKTTYVRHTTVGRAEHGVVDKKYKMKGQK
jgi:hypothetical protein